MLDRSIWLPDPTGDCKPLSSLDVDDFRFYSDSEIIKMQQRLSTLTETGGPGDLEDYDKNNGLCL